MSPELSLRPLVEPVSTSNAVCGALGGGGSLVSVAYPHEGESVLQRHDPRTLEPDGGPLVIPAFARLALSPDGRRLVVAALPEGDAPGFLAVLVVADWSEQRRVDVASTISGVSWADDERLVVGTVDSPAVVEVWSAALTRTHSLAVDEPFAEVSARGDLVAAAANELYLWRVGELAPHFQSTSDHPPSARYGFGTCGVLLDDERFAAHHYDRSPENAEADIVTIRSLADPLGTGVPLMGPPGVYELAASPNGERLALRLVEDPDQPTTVRVHDTRDGRLLALLEDTPVGQVAWMDEDTLVIAGGTLSTWRLGD